MKTYTLPRRADAPLTFTGELVAESHGKESKRGSWYNVSVYHTVGAHYIVAVEYCTTFRYERRVTDIVIVETPEEVAAELRGYDPMFNLLGIPKTPPLDRWERRQAMLEKTMRGEFERQVAEVLSGFVEVVE